MISFKHPSISVLPDQIERFDRLSATWWHARGPMRPLHVVNALRRGASKPPWRSTSRGHRLKACAGCEFSTSAAAPA